MSDSLKIPLRPLVERRERKDSLPVEISQINAQWGSFRDVTEEKLLREAQTDAGAAGDVKRQEQVKEESTTELDSTERLDQLYKRRAEITQFAQ